MDRVVAEQYLARAAAAASVRELHALARAVRAAHAADPDAERVERACWAAALRLVSDPPAGRPAPPPPAPRAAHRGGAQGGYRGPERRAVPRPPTDAAHVDWKERAAMA